MKVNVSLRNILCITTMGFLQLFLPTICKNSFNKNAIAKFTLVFKLLLNIDVGYYYYYLVNFSRYAPDSRES